MAYFEGYAITKPCPFQFGSAERKSFLPLGIRTDMRVVWRDVLPTVASR